jgi:AcrR family transcriptional regulator
MSNAGGVTRQGVALQQNRSFDRLEAIIGAARELMLVGGDGAVTMRSITAAVGGSPAAIYRYFPDRVALLDGVVTREDERLHEEFSRQLGSTGPVSERDILECAVRALVELRTGASGSLALATNSARLAPGEDHVAVFARSIAEHVQQQTHAPVPAYRLRRYVAAIAVIDAVLVGARRNASRARRSALLATCSHLMLVACPEDRARSFQGAA